MQRQKSLKLNLVMNAILTMSGFIFPLITFPYVSRILLPIGTGKVSFATSLISYFSIFAQLGIPTYGIRACAKVRDDRDALSKTVHELFIINSIGSVLSYVAIFFALVFVPRLQKDRTLYFVVSLTIFFNCIGMEWLYKALEQYTYITIRSIIFKFIALFAMFFLVKKQSDYVAYSAISIFAASASNILNFINAQRYITLRLVGGYEFKKHLKAVIVFLAMACATTVYIQLSTVMLGFMATDADIGFYNAAIKVKSILIAIVTSLGTVLLPRASYYVQAGKMDEFKRITNKALNFVVLLATPMALYFTLFAKQSIHFLASAAFEKAIVPMQLMMPTLLLIGLTNVLGIQVLVPLGKEKIVLYSEIAGAVVSFSLNLLLIPSMAATGAAIGTLTAEVAVLIVQFFASRNRVLYAFRQIHYGNILLALTIGSAASLGVYWLHMSNFFTLIASAGLFFIGYMGCLLLTKEPLIIEIAGHRFGKLLKKKKT